MAFNQNDPGSSDPIRIAPGQLQANWKALEEGSEDDAADEKLRYWAANFYARDVISPTSGNNAPVADDGIAIYSKNDPSPYDQPQLYATYSDGTNVQLLKGPPTVAVPGETSLPGGILLKMATVSSLSIGANAYTWSAIGLEDFPTAALSVHFTQFNASTGASSLVVSAFSTTGFTITSGGIPGAGLQVQILALGY